MPRSSWKIPFVDYYLLKKIDKYKESEKSKPIKTWSRRSTITPKFIGVNFLVHNGKKFIPVMVTEYMIGHKLGEFAITRTFYGHAGDKKAKK